MGQLAGHEQTQVYIEEGLWPLVAVLAKKLGVPAYKLVNEALREQLARHFKPAQLRALRALLTKPVAKTRRAKPRKR